MIKYFRLTTKVAHASRSGWWTFCGKKVEADDTRAQPGDKVCGHCRIAGPRANAWLPEKVPEEK